VLIKNYKIDQEGGAGREVAILTGSSKTTDP
jgi:hypothetical protein